MQDRLDDRKNTLELLAPAARQLLSEKGYDQVYGARPLKRAIQKYLENPLSMEILKGNVPDGSKVEADVEGGEVAFRIQ